MNETLEPPDPEALAVAAKQVAETEQMVRETAAAYARRHRDFTLLDQTKKREGLEPWPAWKEAQQKAYQAWEDHDQAIRLLAQARNRLSVLQGKPGFQVPVAEAVPKNLLPEEAFEITPRMRFIQWMVETGRLNDDESEPVVPEPEPEPDPEEVEPDMDEKRKRFGRWLIANGRLNEAA